MTDPPGRRGPQSDGIMITLKDVYLEVRSLAQQVAALAGHQKEIADHEVRLRALERWRYGLPGALIMAAGSLVAALWPR